MYVVKMSTRGRITLPAELRRQEKLKPGTILIVQPTQEGFLLIKKSKYVEWKKKVNL
ncbi:MAG TPA: AbrB/MazE/SpoVT family DNA-binding domain-containing protein [archaeon]|nr:AbrB/MazE/SpoVT family DNA-binding domain-containing protein [archaeon]